MPPPNQSYLGSSSGASNNGYSYSKSTDTQSNGSTSSSTASTTTSTSSTSAASTSTASTPQTSTPTCSFGSLQASSQGQNIYTTSLTISGLTSISYANYSMSFNGMYTVNLGSTSTAPYSVSFNNLYFAYISSGSWTLTASIMGSDGTPYPNLCSAQVTINYSAQ